MRNAPTPSHIRSKPEKHARPGVFRLGPGLGSRGEVESASGSNMRSHWVQVPDIRNPSFEMAGQLLQTEPRAGLVVLRPQAR
jgi:hypothetical protein